MQWGYRKSRDGRKRVKIDLERVNLDEIVIDNVRPSPSIIRPSLRDTSSQPLQPLYPTPFRISVPHRCAPPLYLIALPQRPSSSA